MDNNYLGKILSDLILRVASVEKILIKKNLVSEKELVSEFNSLVIEAEKLAKNLSSKEESELEDDYDSAITVNKKPKIIN